MEARFGNLTFTSKFDSGNLARVEKVSKEDDEEVSNANVNYYLGDLRHDAEFNLWTKPDCAGSPAENSNRSWFYFGVRGWVPNRLIKFNIMNMNRQGKLYGQGYTPLTRLLPSRPKWERIRDKPTFEVIDNQFILTFTYRFPDLKGGTCYFAFSYPWSYTESQEQLQILDKRFEHCLHMSPGSPPERLYYHRELLCYSLDKLRVDLLTITSCHGNTFCRETRFDKHLFPDQDTPRCYKFKDKRVFLLSSRVHPGETPGSFVFNGFLDFILRENDLRAAQLRQQYVFKLIPMLNPDGVMRGHYRTDQRGMNLNRMYLDPSPILHPSIYAAKSLLVYHHVMNQLPRLGGEPLKIHINFPCDEQSSGKDGPGVPNSPQERSGGDQDVLQSGEHDITLSSDSHKQTTRRQNETKTKSYQHPLVSASLKHVPAIQSNSEKWLEANIAGGTTSLELLSQQESAKVEPLNLTDLYMSDESASDSCPPAGLENNQIFHVSSSSSSVVSLDKLHLPATGMVNGQAEMHHVDSELCLHLSELNMSEDLCSNTLADDASFDSDTEATERLGNEGSEDEEASPVTLEGLSGNCSPHLSDAQLLEIHPHDSGVAFYMDLHGHASKRGCFIYGNYFDNEDIQLESILYAKLIALNSAHFDFGACNFSERNMYLKDKRDGFSKEGSGRVAIYKAIGIIHSYTLECNYNMGRLVNSVPPAFRDDGRATPPPLAGFPPKFTQAHYEEVGRAVAVAVLDMRDTNPWSRVSLSEYNSIHGLRDWVRRYLRSLRGGPRIPRNPSLKSMNKNGNNGLPGKSDLTPVQNTTRVSAGRVIGLDSSSRASAIRQTSQNSATTGRRELAPVKEATRNTTFSNMRTQMRRHSSTSSSPPKLSSLSGPSLPVPPVQTQGNSEHYSMMTTSSIAADTKVMRHFSADSSFRLHGEDKVQQLKNCVAIARRGGPTSRIPLPTSQSRLTLTAQANSLSDAGLTVRVLSKTTILGQTQTGTSNLSPVSQQMPPSAGLCLPLYCSPPCRTNHWPRFTLWAPRCYRQVHHLHLQPIHRLRRLRSLQGHSCRWQVRHLSLQLTPCFIKTSFSLQQASSL
ncbi:cytosolic carboxypeptidase-like protein 5 isoform X2 [Pomacea canaliculata]|uniref:cytosolic carboxypeptidase-like protein 5 isoform X2 n=1 Tax=Pomacea canaliculata TaxID=400727 RepID=UPI000D7386AB|nr:cytosolic carboxypeptidase-like protein 5 isoform X2 [Pomacea canaliculata]